MLSPKIGRDVIQPAIGSHHGVMVTEQARHIERSDAEFSILPRVIGSIGWSKWGIGISDFFRASLV
jgi:hypothetical protein